MRPSSAQSDQPPRALTNYGERLYHKGLKRKEEQQRLLRDVRAHQELAALQEHCSFQPQINAVSRLIAPRVEGPTEDALIKYGQHAKERLEQRRSELLFQEVSAYRFQP